MIRTAGGSRFLVCRPLAREGLAHAFTLRPENRPEAAARGAWPAGIIREIGLQEVPFATPEQAHGSAVARPSPSGRTAEPLRADAVVVDRARGGAAIATADCVGAILHAPEARAFAVVHAGWRGTLAGVLREAAEALKGAAGAGPGEMTLAMGPAIGRCCYEVGEDVAAPFRRAFPESLRPRLFGARGGRPTLDLIEANRFRAEECGIDPRRIHAAQVCTSCRKDLCWSYRSEGESAGRMWTLAGFPR